MNLKKVLSAALIVLMTFTIANIALAQSGSNQYLYVVKVQVGIDGYLYINVKGNFDLTKHGCTNGAFARSAEPLPNEITKAMMSIAMTSFLGRKGVHVTTNGCAGGYPILRVIQVNQD